MRRHALTLEMRFDVGAGRVESKAGDRVCFARNGTWVNLRIKDFGISEPPEGPDGLPVSPPREWLTARGKPTKLNEFGKEYYFEGAQVDKLRWLARPEEVIVPAPIVPLPPPAKQGAQPAPVNDDVPSEDGIFGAPYPERDCTETELAIWLGCNNGQKLTPMRLEYHRAGWNVASAEYEAAEQEYWDLMEAQDTAQNG